MFSGMFLCSNVPVPWLLIAIMKGASPHGKNTAGAYALNMGQMEKPEEKSSMRKQLLLLLRPTKCQGDLPTVAVPSKPNNVGRKREVGWWV